MNTKRSVLYNKRGIFTLYIYPLLKGINKGIYLIIKDIRAASRQTLLVLKIYRF